MRKDEAAVRLRQESLDEERNIFLALAQRRQRQADDVKAVKQIFAKTPRLDLFLQIPVRRRHNANVDLDTLQRAHRAQFLLLQHPQQLDLKLEREFPDFVEKRRAAVSQLKQAALVVDRARERSPDMAKKFALHHRSHQRSAIDGHELPARRHVIKRARRHLFTRAGFALNQHG